MPLAVQNVDKYEVQKVSASLPQFRLLLQDLCRGVDKLINDASYGEDSSYYSTEAREKVSKGFLLLLVFHHHRRHLVTEEDSRHATAIATHHTHNLAVSRHAELVGDKGTSIHPGKGGWHNLDVVLKHLGAFLSHTLGPIHGVGFTRNISSKAEMANSVSDVEV